MSNLAKIWKELFWVLLEEEISDLGVFQTPCPTAVGHTGECGANAAAASNYLGLRQRLASPHQRFICRTKVSYVFKAAKTRKKIDKILCSCNAGKFDRIQFRNLTLPPDKEIKIQQCLCVINSTPRKRNQTSPRMLYQGLFPSARKNAKQGRIYDISHISQEWLAQNPDEAQKKKINLCQVSIETEPILMKRDGCVQTA